MDAVLQLLSQHAAPAAFLLLVACGLGLPPWSEEIVILAAGHFVAEGHLSFLTALGACWVGILGGDTVIFLLGRYAGERVYKWPFPRHHMGPRNRHRFNRTFLNHGTKAVFLARFVPGFRMIAYFVAGNLRMPFWKFSLLDSLGAILTVLGLVSLGKIFSENLDGALILIHRFQIPLIIGGILMAVGAGWWLAARRRRRLASLRRQRARQKQRRSTDARTREG
ncbi:MAG: DedA family protein [Planctomycetota bacterium]